MITDHLLWNLETNLLRIVRKIMLKYNKPI